MVKNKGIDKLTTENLGSKAYKNQHVYINGVDLLNIVKGYNIADNDTVSKLLKKDTEDTIVALKLESVVLDKSLNKLDNKWDKKKLYFYLHSTALGEGAKVSIYSKYLDVKDIVFGNKLSKETGDEKIGVALNKDKFEYYLSIKLGENFCMLGRNSNIQKGKLTIVPKTFNICIVRLDKRSRSKKTFYTVGEFFNSMLR